MSIVIEDDGTGLRLVRARARGWGSPGMRERVEPARRRHRDRVVPGVGTTIVAELPVREDA